MADLTGKTVVIIGWPASGKTTLAGRLAEQWPDHKVIELDLYAAHGWEQALYVAMRDILACQQPMIIEGVQGYRLLRKGVQTASFYPDIVIELLISEEQQARIYETSRKQISSGVLAMNKALGKVKADYLQLPNPKPPQWHHLSFVSDGNAAFLRKKQNP